MENNLYYTPTIEEFHVGFEYEYMNGDMWEESEMRIQDYKSDGPDYERSDSWFEEEILGGIRTVRVKYLDQSDIESLGWIHKQYVPNRNICLNFELPNDWFLNYWFGEIPYVEVSRDGYDTSFALNVKNKSELIKLIQQLNIK